MKFVLYFWGLIFVFFDLGSLPLLLDVQIAKTDKIEINYRIEKPEEKMLIDLGCFRKSDREIIKIDEKYIIGDLGILDEKEEYFLEINLAGLPSDFNLEDFIILPKLLYQDRIYYEMEKISAGSYPVFRENNLIEMVSAKEFFISKFETTNEQFLSFVNADGYEFEEFWEIDPNLMSKSNIGWFYQARYKMSLPFGWSFGNDPLFKDADSDFLYGPVTNIRWFEANAFCNWMEGEMPSLNQIEIVFEKAVKSDADVLSGISIFDGHEFPLQKISDGVSEWLMSGVDPTSAACGGCNEMFVLKNNSNQQYERVFTLLKCPLYREIDLGFRLVVE
ncbi:MAG: SUMF1/EgtB/PvdO family nonheme iron enzyme [Candidatus Cloacimonetes bacterium]|nr:SUMF1/EgtB/PvdO family nonheme iron enzyme [Candidatus Cloacimonadota bacterium]